MTIDDEMKQKLLALAVQARQWAYAPYSHYAVGAALLTASGKIYDGVNIENAAYPVTVCAERVAVFKAVSEGERHFTAIAVVTQNGGSPCGSCRQALAEAEVRFGKPIRIILDGQDSIIVLKDVESLLPLSFSKKSL